MGNPLTGLLRKLGLKKAPEGTPPPQPGASNEGAKAPNIEGMNFANTSFAEAPNVTRGTSEAGTPFAVVEKPAVPAMPETPAAAPNGIEAAAPTAPVSPEGALPVK